MKTSIIRACLFATTGAVLVSGTGFTAAAQAQDSRAAASAEDAETLVVTARRRSESVLEAPISVTAISGDLLRNSGISELRDVLALVPNAVIQDSSESLNTHVNIRGMLMVDIQACPSSEHLAQLAA